MGGRAGREEAEGDRGGAPDGGREHEAAGDVCREGSGEGGEAEGQNPEHPAEVQGGRSRFEYGEMNITKLQRIDDIEDEIYREKLKIKKVADELGDTFDDMLAHY